MSDITSQVPPTPPLAKAIMAGAPAPAAAVVRPEPRLRLWPGVLILALQWLAVLVPAWMDPGGIVQFYFKFLAPMVGAAALGLWWLFASRLRWRDRFLVLAIFGAAAGAGMLLYHPTFLFQLFGPILYALPAATAAWVLWLLVTPFLRWPARRAGLLVVILLAWLAWALVRVDGVTGNLSATLGPRWGPNAEERFLAEQEAHKPAAAWVKQPAADEPLVLRPGDWPGFRGPDRDGRQTGVRIAADWKESGPQRELWRHRVGPGWSSFALVGPRLFTQEQRGPDEAVICYTAETGQELWVHLDPIRFSEQASGPGPRATPTFHDGKLYALGAGGLLNCLDPATGKVRWTRDVLGESGAQKPQWGVSSSPLVARGRVIVCAGGTGGRCLLAYDATSGEPAWDAGEGEHGYCSPQLAKLAGREQVLIATQGGLRSFDPETGKALWQHDWPVSPAGPRVVQPAVVSDTDVLLGTGFGMGTRRLHVGREGDGWKVDEVWTTRAINPYFNDLVVHKGHLYGFDGVFFTCVGLEDGQKRWRTRGYGNGQVLLLADQDLLLVLSEQGAVALVEATPAGHKEWGRFQAITGKTWNHPVVVRDKLYVRNGEEAACYHLPQEGEK
jgi:outer membrane protein assembly factor BamB